jgi:outer membrane scaffolding protein for murein synthesis (MipA/OmpV family)
MFDKQERVMIEENRQGSRGCSGWLALLPGLVLALMTLPAQADIKPKWELGVGLATIDFPLYRGADERRSYLLPVPYFQYHGEILQISRDRMRGLFFRSGRFELDFSVNGAVPVNSGDSAVRRGMPDLDPTLEIGPSLNVHLYFEERRQTNLDLRLPLRKVIATNFSRFEDQGWLFHPQLALDFRNVQQSGWNLGLVGGLIYADQRYHQYFYDVAPQYVTATRPAYSAGGGYSGAQVMTTVSKRYDSFWIGGFMRWDDLSGAAFVDSPLVKSRQSFAVGLMVSWILFSSDKPVEVSND